MARAARLKTTFFFACLCRASRRRHPRTVIVPPPDFTGLRLDNLPVYSVLVAQGARSFRSSWLRSRRAGLAAQQAGNKARLRGRRRGNALGDSRAWPAASCRGAGSAARPAAHEGEALAFALQVVSGDYVVLYDAEDRPHPSPSWRPGIGTTTAAPELACLQAPLEISNAQASAIARLFAFEYCGLFSGMLAWLSARKTYCRSAAPPIISVPRAWRPSAAQDPYNVTEDAEPTSVRRCCDYRTRNADFRSPGGCANSSPSGCRNEHDGSRAGS